MTVNYGRTVQSASHCTAVDDLDCCDYLFFLFTLPKIRQVQAQLEVQRIQDIAAENRRYCEKWGFPVGTDKHTACTLDLQELRAKIEQRASDSVLW